ncbi:helix-turn-helix transcriptional regulator [Klebsiella oxytoca]|uniref:helix-turn-helix transcriptional regulator n=1 Tax=Klebsiella oxytoca TaxID=571 RepID=UPI00190ECD20|nr:LuxR C-terminal-related transcriptional regulator [Klebsiella oxytoca]
MKINDTTTRSANNFDSHLKLTPKAKEVGHFEHRLSNQSILFWPGQNSMIKHGINTIISRFPNKKNNNNFVFVDMNIQTMCFFLKSNWFEKFKNHKIVIICDRHMIALANFWFFDTLDLQVISAIFPPTDSFRAIEEKFSDILNGKQFLPERAQTRLSSNEFLMLRFFFNGLRIKEIAYEYKYSVKTIYTYKRRIEKKLRIRIPKS